MVERRYIPCECGRQMRGLKEFQCEQCLQDLTSYQKGILTFYAWGLSIKQIGMERGCESEKAIEYQMAMIKEKLGLRSTAELVRYAVHEGLIPNFIRLKRRSGG